MILAFLATRVGQAVAIAIAVLLAFFIFPARHDKRIEAKTEQKVALRSEQQGKANAAKSERAHSDARKPGALDRLRADPRTCPDCGGKPLQELEAPNDQRKRPAQ